MTGGLVVRAGRRSLLGLCAFVLTVGVTGVAGGLGGPAWAADGVGVAVKLNTRDIATADANNPLRLTPQDGVVISVEVTNNGTAPVDVRNVKLDSQVLGLAFFTYSTRVDLTVPPGGTGTRTFALDLFDLGSQATGLLPARVSLIDPGRNTIAERSLIVDVRGSAFSVYGVFGLAIAVVSLLLLFGLVARLVSRRLPDNRWSRAWRFLLPGVGLGLTATLAAGIVRAFVPSSRTSVVLLVVGAVVGFVAGYLSPQPGDRGDEDSLDDRDLFVDDDSGSSTDAGLGLVGVARSAGPTTHGPAHASPPAGDNVRTTTVGGQAPPPAAQ